VFLIKYNLSFVSKKKKKKSNYREADVLEKLDLFYAPKNEEHLSSPCDILFLLSL
jgi:hypothetical protein